MNIFDLGQHRGSSAIAAEHRGPMSRRPSCSMFLNPDGVARLGDGRPVAAVGRVDDTILQGQRLVA